jgi:hypothetical protein
MLAIVQHQHVRATAETRSDPLQNGLIAPLVEPHCGKKGVRDHPSAAYRGEIDEDDRDR